MPASPLLRQAALTVIIESKMTLCLENENCFRRRQSLRESLHGTTPCPTIASLKRQSQNSSAARGEKAIAAKGAQTQRIGLASTSTPESQYRDVLTWRKSSRGHLDTILTQLSKLPRPGSSAPASPRSPRPARHMENEPGRHLHEGSTRQLVVAE